MRNQNLGSQEAIKTLGQLLHQLLVFVEFLEVLNALVWDTCTLCLLAMHSIAQHANLHAWPWHVWQLDRSSEALVSLCVVILQSDLQLHGLQELARLLLGTLNHVTDALLQDVKAQLAHCFA